MPHMPQAPPKSIPKQSPIRPRAPPHGTAPHARQVDAVAQTPKAPVISNELARNSHIFKKRRNGLWAAGVAVIVGAGAILGAQLKTQQQKKRDQIKVGEQDTVESGLPVETANTSLATPIPGAETKKIAKQGQDDIRVVAKGANDSVRGSSYDQRQLSILEDRRGALMKQRSDLEKKIERVREKRRREEQVEARRAPSKGPST